MFWIASDDFGELYLERDGSLQRIAHVPGYTGVNEWNKYAEQNQHAAETDGRGGIATIRLSAEGEVLARGPQMLVGYVHAEDEATVFDDQGFYRTGDQGRWVDDNYLVISGRIKDIIIRKGENISAKEVEDLLYAHPKVGDVAVIGLPDRERGERVCAVVEPPEGGEAITFDEMVAHLAEHGLTRFKTPEQLEVVDSLPRNETLRKVLKYKLREEFAGKQWP